MFKLWAVISPMISDQACNCDGVYSTEENATAQCPEGSAIVLVELDKPWPEHAGNAEKLYYPHLEKWEDSALYKMRSEAKQNDREKDRR